MKLLIPKIDPCVNLPKTAPPLAQVSVRIDFDRNSFVLLQRLWCLLLLLLARGRFWLRLGGGWWTHSLYNFSNGRRFNCGHAMGSRRLMRSCGPSGRRRGCRGRRYYPGRYAGRYRLLSHCRDRNGHCVRISLRYRAVDYDGGLRDSSRRGYEGWRDIAECWALQNRTRNLRHDYLLPLRRHCYHLLRSWLRGGLWLQYDNRLRTGSLLLRRLRYENSLRLSLH